MTLQELITDLKAAGANDNTMQLAMNCYELGLANAQRKPLTSKQIREIEVDVALNPSFDYPTPAEHFVRFIEAAHGIKGPA
jgi:hypothetical protein